jgi:LDH2 family malate/lactate/ureidoglycolate dehydrogenase
MAVKFDSYTMSIEGHQKICRSVFKAAGMSEQCANEVADNLLFADLRGTNSHGITRLKLYTDNARSGYFNVKGEPEIISDRGATIHIDGHNGFGAHVSVFAMKKTIERAKELGIALCSVRHSTHFGAAAYYSMMALEHNCIGFALTNALPSVAHHASKRPQVGTNPLTIAFPAKRNRPYVLDMATSVVAGGNVINCAREGTPIPLGWACDKDGNPTTDPKAALSGYYLPLGGYKGSGIALAIDVLCGILSGGNYGLHITKADKMKEEEIKNGPGICHMFAAIDISFFCDPEEFKETMDRFIDELKEAPVAPGYDKIMVAGEPEFLNYEKYSKEGIPCIVVWSCPNTACLYVYTLIDLTSLPLIPCLFLILIAASIGGWQWRHAA